MESGPSRNWKLVVEYEGTGLAGWQRQPDRPTVQGRLEEALAKIMGHEITLIGAGRTDAGVHARGQTANFKTTSPRKPHEILRGGNALLPDQISILSVEEVSSDFHSRYSALSKIYDYYIDASPVPRALRRSFSWRLGPGLDLENMAAAMALLPGEHDFAGFQSTGTPVKSTVRNMMIAELAPGKDGLFKMTFEADGFLRHMVRALVGTIVLVGQGRISVVEFEEILGAADRALAGRTAPACGLFLREVKY